MTQPQFNNSKLAKIMSFEAYQRLTKWTSDQQNPMPEHCKTPLLGYFQQAPHKQYHSKQLEKIIIKVLNKSGSIAVKVKNAGQYLDKSKQVTDVVGRVRTVGSKGFVRDTNVIKGMADIRADIIGGLTWYIEVKIDDRQSEVQKEFESKITGLGHHYTIVRTVDDFMEQYSRLTGKELL